MVAKLVVGVLGTWPALSLRVDRKSNQFGLKMPAEASIDFQKRSPSPLVDIVNANGVESAGAASFTTAAISVNMTDGRMHVESSAAVPDRTPVAWARYNNSVFQAGWAHLHVGVTEDEKISDDVKMYAAGYLEGLLSAGQIRDFQHNAGILLEEEENRHQAMENIKDLMGRRLFQIRNRTGMMNNATLTASNAPSDNWLRHSRYALLQTWGILDAYNNQVDRVKGNPMSMVGMIVLSSDGETPELEMAYDSQEYLLRQAEREDAKNGVKSDDLDSFLQFPKGVRVGKHDREKKFHADLRALDDAKWRRIKDSTGRCSALVRLTPDYKDLLVGHTTFSDYSEMNRIWKYYDFPLQGASARRMGFSSYPGVAGSTDDYYIMDNGIVVTETTVSMLSDESFDKLDDKDTELPDFMRIMLANRLAKSSYDWARLMNESSTGTYNSQWMVVDYRRFTPGKKLDDGAFYVVEQIPGLTHMEDMTSKLRKEGYWASENRAWFQDVRDSMGATEAEESHGVFGRLFSASNSPRARIFAATAPAVHSLSDMRHEMRRNNWPKEVDGGPTNTPDHAIAARGDLDKEHPNPNGGVDSKVTNRCLVRKMMADAVSGPTHDTLSPFSWTDARGKELYPGTPHDGQPNLWNFDWVRMSPDGELAATDDPRCDE